MVLEEAVVVLTLSLLAAVYMARRYYRAYMRERSRKASLATKHGMTFEQLMPLADEFPGDPRSFRFLGNPIDGVLFGDEKVTFIEFKTGGSRLSSKQRRIKEMIEDGRVEWKVLRP